MPTGNDAANDILDAIYGAGHAAAFGASSWLAVYYVAPTNAGGGTEATYTNYGRIEIDNDNVSWAAAADRRKVLQIDIQLATPGSDTSPIVAWALHRHATNDDIIHWGLFNDLPQADSGEPISIPAGVIEIQHN